MLQSKRFAPTLRLLGVFAFIGIAGCTVQKGQTVEVAAASGDFISYEYTHSYGPTEFQAAQERAAANCAARGRHSTFVSDAVKNLDRSVATFRCDPNADVAQDAPASDVAPGHQFALPPGVFLGTPGKDSIEYFKDPKLHKALYRHRSSGMYFEANEMPSTEMAQRIAAERCMSVAAQLRQSQNDCQLIAVDNDRLATPLNVRVSP